MGENISENAVCKMSLILYRREYVNSLTQIWVNKLTIIGSDNGLSPGRRQAIIWTNAGMEYCEMNYELMELQWNLDRNFF